MDRSRKCSDPNYMGNISNQSDQNDFPFKNLQSLMDSKNLSIHHHRGQFSAANRQSRSVDDHCQGIESYQEFSDNNINGTNRSRESSDSFQMEFEMTNEIGLGSSEGTNQTDKGEKQEKTKKS